MAHGVKAKKRIFIIFMTFSEASGSHFTEFIYNVQCSNFVWYMRARK